MSAPLWCELWAVCRCRHCRRAGWAKRKRAHHFICVELVGTAQMRLCPPYETALLAMTPRCESAISPHALRELCYQFPALSISRAQGGRAPDAPRGLVCKME